MCRPTKTTTSEVDGSSYRAGALFARVHSAYPSAVTEKTAGTVGNSSVKVEDDVILTADVTCTGEGKLELGPNQIVDNEMKVLGQAGHMFYHDVGRTAVWTFTIESSQMRMWNHSRSHTGVTEPFDIYKDHNWFIHFVLFNTYAPLTTLGIDPTVKRVMDKAGNLQYQFGIYRPDDPTPRVYETTRLLNERFAETFYTRVMRVFAVRRVEKDTADPSKRLYSTDTQVLRDYWVYNHVPDESSIQEAIKDEMRKHADIWPDAEKHIIGIEEDGMVYYPNVGTPEKGKGPGCVPAPPKGAERYDFKSEDNPEGSKPRRAQIKLATTVQTPDSGNTPRHAPKALADELFRLHSKKHCRTIYSQICIDLYAVDDPALFFHALSQISKILRYLKRAGYLHRDVSPGNFLLYRKASDGTSESKQRQLALEEWVTFITDLEYARPYTGSTGHGSITGTSAYIAVEVQRQTHLFLPKIFGDVFQGAENFAFNFYHDLESVIWMALDFAFCKISKTLLASIPDLSDARLKLLRSIAIKLFPGVLEGSPDRTYTITMVARLSQLLRDLYSLYGQGAPIAKVVKLASSLNEAYEKLQSDVTTPFITLDSKRIVYDPKLFLDDIYIEMEKTFREISNHYVQNPDTFLPVPDEPPRPRRKLRGSSVGGGLTSEEVAAIFAELDREEEERKQESWKKRMTRAESNEEQPEEDTAAMDLSPDGEGSEVSVRGSGARKRSAPENKQRSVKRSRTAGPQTEPTRRSKRIAEKPSAARSKPKASAKKIRESMRGNGNTGKRGRLTTRG
ncbi:hypothetical protein EV122DRAFT_217784 [Schizophyllum commune]